MAVKLFIFVVGIVVLLVAVAVDSPGLMAISAGMIAYPAMAPLAELSDPEPEEKEAPPVEEKEAPPVVEEEPDYARIRALETEIYGEALTPEGG